MNYRLLAIAKTQHGSIQYAIVETESGYCKAIAKCKDGACFKVDFLDASPVEMKWILKFIQDKEGQGIL